MTWSEAMARACQLAARFGAYRARFYVSSYMQGDDRVYEVRCAGPRGPQGCAL